MDSYLYAMRDIKNIEELEEQEDE